MNNQARKQSGRPLRIDFDDFKPGSDVQDMGAVDLDLPVVVHPLQHGCLKSQVNDRVDEKIDQVDLVGFVDPFAHVQHTIQRRSRISAGLLF